MAGYLVLEGGAEFSGQMAAPDRRALELAGGVEAKISIIPTAAAPDNNHRRAGKNGERWFRGLGARQVEMVPLIDKASANGAAIAAVLRDSKLIYMLGGFTDYLGQTLRGSQSWEAAYKAYQAGAVLAGSSAGAMVLCEHYFDPSSGQVKAGLNLVPNACVLPHHNTFGHRWASNLTQLLPKAVLVGIDEQTGIIDDGPDRSWTVYGQGLVTLYRQGQPKVYNTGDVFTL